jgi:5-methylcytosine-specific restriction endonuclease McrA
MTGSPIRQDYLETALNWISGDKPASYMAAHQADKTAIELWNYFTSVMNWVNASFTVVRKEMKSVPWGELYNKHKDDDLDPAELEKRVAELMQDEEVQKKSGIYAFLLTADRKHLNLRTFSDKVKSEAYNKQGGVCGNTIDCPEGGKKLKLEDMEADHIDPWHSGGRTVLSNCRMLCKACNRRKAGK